MACAWGLFSALLACQMAKWLSIWVVKSEVWLLLGSRGLSCCDGIFLILRVSQVETGEVFFAG